MRLGNISLLDAFQDASSQGLVDRVIASVINIQQEGTLRNLPFRNTRLNGEGVPQGIERQPDIHLNVFVLFGANKADYSLALQRISQVIAFFQRQFVFTPDDIAALEQLNVSRLIFDLYSTSFEELNQIWGVNGGKYVPSVVYKMRLAVIQNAPEVGAGIVSEINLNSSVQPPLVVESP